MYTHITLHLVIVSILPVISCALSFPERGSKFGLTKLHTLSFRLGFLEAYAMQVMERSPGPSFWGRHQPPVNGVPSGITNLGSTKTSVKAEKLGKTFIPSCWWPSPSKVMKQIQAFQIIYILRDQERPTFVLSNSTDVLSRFCLYHSVSRMTSLIHIDPRDADVVWIWLILFLLKRSNPLIHLFLCFGEVLGLKVCIHAQRAISSPCKVVISWRAWNGKPKTHSQKHANMPLLCWTLHSS